MLLYDGSRSLFLIKKGINSVPNTTYNTHRGLFKLAAKTQTLAFALKEKHKTISMGQVFGQ